MQFVPWADAHDKFVKSIAGGTTPDVAEVGTTWTPEFADAGALVDLTDAVNEAGLDDDLVSGLVEAGTVDGALYGMPWYAGVRSMVYRTDVFEKAGIEPPTTWDELVAAGEEMKKAEPDMIPFPIAGDSEYGVYPFIWGDGGEIAEQDGDAWTSTIDSPEAQEGIEFYTGLATRARALLTRGDHLGRGRPLRRVHPRRRRDDDRRQLDARPRWSRAHPDLEGKIGAFPIPGPDGGLSPSFLGGSHLSIFNTTENADLAFALVRMMGTGEFADEVGPAVRLLPGHQHAARGGPAAGRPAGRAVRPAGLRGGQERAGDAALRPDPGQEDASRRCCSRSCPVTRRVADASTGGRRRDGRDLLARQLEQHA